MERTGQRLTKPELGYLAGFLDGEGSFGFYGSTASVKVSNCYPRVLEWMQSIYGGSIYSDHGARSSKHRLVFRWTVSGEAARRLCSDVIPYLQEKVRQAETLMKIHKYPPRSAMRVRLIKELKDLKHIEYAL